MEMNNPALRLFELLSKLRSANGNKVTSSVLADVFEVQNTPKQLFRAIAEFHELVDDVVEFATQHTALPAAPLLRYVPQIESAVHYTNLDAPWSNYTHNITAGCLVVLEMIAHTDGVDQDRAASDEDMLYLRMELDDLFEFVSASSSLSKEFRHFVLQQIEKIRRCLAEYKISGPQGFSKYLETLIVQVSRNAELIREEKEKNPEAVSRLSKVFGYVATFVALSKDGVKLLADCKKMYKDTVDLLPGSSSTSGDEIPEVDGTDMV